MGFTDRSAERAALRERLATVLDELAQLEVTQAEIAAESGRAWSTIYRQAAGDTKPDPRLIEHLERELAALKARREAASAAFRGVSYLPVLGSTGSGQHILRGPIHEGARMPVPQSALISGRDYGVVEVGERSETCGLEPGEALLIERGGEPTTGKVIVFCLEDLVGAGRVEHPKGKGRRVVYDEGTADIDGELEMVGVVHKKMRFEDV